jgi:pSer/pThr/pTyr-binding forkhead associated (FHA) protein
MDIEIVVLGESNKWVLNQSRIRIGQDSHCEVSLPAGKYPSLSGEHVVLEVVNGAITLAKGRRPGSETYLNGRPAVAGVELRSGDLLRLGAGGPELRIRLLEREANARPAEYEPTRVLYQAAPAAPDAHEPTRVMHEPTRVVSGPAATTYSPAPSTPAAGAAVRQGYSTQANFSGSSTPYTPPASPRRPDAAPAGYGQTRGQETAARATESESMHTLEQKLKSNHLLLVVNFFILALLLVLVFMQGRELAQTHKEVQELRVQAQSAMGQLTPSLDARLNVFEKRMDGMDAKIAVAQDRMVKGMDAQAKLAEDRLVERMNAEIPAMMDKYVAKKMADIKH